MSNSMSKDNSQRHRGIGTRYCYGIVLIALASFSTIDVQEVKKESSKDKSAETQEQSREQAEFERRMNSVAKTIEKEDRPEIPEFKNRSGGNGAITFDDLQFEMKKTQRFKRAMLTDPINAMVGQRLQLKGYIHPNSKKSKMKKFIFVRDDKECCFGPTAALFDCVLVTLGEGEFGKYSLRPVTVEGDFFLKEFNGPDGRVWAIYRMKNGVIK